jgi:hypothetical protein
LIAEFSSAPETENNSVISNLRAVLYSGRILPHENGLLHFEPRDLGENPPSSFGGMSGGGVWRVYYDENKGDTDALSTLMLCGIASWERADNQSIACQGWDRIDQALLPEVRKALPR